MHHQFIFPFQLLCTTFRHWTNSFRFFSLIFFFFSGSFVHLFIFCVTVLRYNVCTLPKNMKHCWNKINTEQLWHRIVSLISSNGPRLPNLCWILLSFIANLCVLVNMCNGLIKLLFQNIILLNPYRQYFPLSSCVECRVFFSFISSSKIIVFVVYFVNGWGGACVSCDCKMPLHHAFRWLVIDTVRYLFCIFFFLLHFTFCFSFFLNYFFRIVFSAVHFVFSYSHLSPSTSCNFFASH